MPQFQFTSALLANGTAQPLTGWQYEYVPWPFFVEIGLNATTANVKATVTSGSDTLMEESTLQGGATAGVIPSPLNVPYLNDYGAAGDRLKINLRETGGAVATVNGIVKLQPVRGRR